MVIISLPPEQKFTLTGEGLTILMNLVRMITTYLALSLIWDTVTLRISILNTMGIGYTTKMKLVRIL